MFIPLSPKGVYTPREVGWKPGKPRRMQKGYVHPWTLGKQWQIYIYIYIYLIGLRGISGLRQLDRQKVFDVWWDMSFKLSLTANTTRSVLGYGWEKPRFIFMALSKVKGGPRFSLLGLKSS